jgi:hypothetical protein
MVDVAGVAGALPILLEAEVGEPVAPVVMGVRRP